MAAKRADKLQIKWPRRRSKTTPTVKSLFIPDYSDFGKFPLGAANVLFPNCFQIVFKLFSNCFQTVFKYDVSLRHASGASIRARTFIFPHLAEMACLKYQLKPPPAAQPSGHPRTHRTAQPTKQAREYNQATSGKGQVRRAKGK